MSTALDTGESAEAPTGQAPRRPRLQWLLIAAVVVIYMGLGVLANLPSWMGGVTHTMQCGGCGDSGQEVWFLAWAAHALTHLQDPLRSNYINFPWGVDLADNTSMPLAGAIATPITVLFGPVTSFNVVFSLAFAGSATAMFFVLRRYTKWIVAAFVGGLLYGFCPYMVGQGEGHIFLLLAPLPPIMFLLLDEIIVRQSARWWLVGIVLGLVMNIQLGWSAELLACIMAVAAIGIVVLAIARPRLVREHFVYAAKALLLAVVVLVPAAAWFALVSRTGPEHIKGAVHSVKALAGLSSDLAGLVVPTVNQHFSFGLSRTGTSFMNLTSGLGAKQVDPAENGSYVGIPILLVLIFGTIRFRREGLLRFSIVMAALSFLISMGSRLHVWGHNTVIRLPFDVIAHLPVLKSEVAGRYCLFMWLFIALSVAVILDRARQSGPARAKLHGRAGLAQKLAHWPLVSLLVLTALGVASLVPGWPYNIGQVVTPPALVPATVVSDISGGTLLTYPIARNTHNLPMVWQSIDGFSYRIPAGEASVANDHYGATEAAFTTCWQIPVTEYEPSLSYLPGARRDFARWQVRAVVIPLSDSINPMCAVRFVQAVLGRPPLVERGSAVWTNLDLGAAKS
ncbi:MAG: hypothetical protein ABSG36_13675 [Acidimicrobiales bacterium]|jgi:hypothetical protein